jgi:acetoin utilization deacetylase AcuC-like enzyme
MTTLYLCHSATLEHRMPPGHPERPDRIRAIERVLEEERFSGLGREQAPRAADREIARAHPQAYLDALREAAPREGFVRVDADTTMSPGTMEAALRGAGAAVRAVDEVMTGAVRNAFAAMRPPGHHAERATPMGFCFFNNAAVAARHAQAAHGAERVAILDWDVHHGNGTQDIFYANGDVLYLSVHQSPFYPGTGRAGEVGEGEGLGLTVNVPLPARSGENLYAAAFAGIFLPVLREFGPRVILVSAGFDAHADDLLGGMALGSDAFGRFAAGISALCHELGAAPPAFILEGGYNLEALTASVAATMRGVGEKPPDWEYTGGIRQVEESRGALAPYWRSLR